MTFIAPILFFAFNRPYHTERSLNSLITNSECKDSNFYAFVDGPRNQDDQIKINDVVKLIKSYKPYFKSFHLTINDKNKGCAQQSIDSLNEFCKTHDYFIYLEDDNIVSRYFLQFINEGLLKYNDAPQVKAISGYIPNIDLKHKNAIFLHSWGSWGFGSWTRSWREFNPDAKLLLQQLKKQNMLKKFTFNHSTYSKYTLQEASKGKKGAWDTRWFASIFLKKGLVLFPHRSLTKNIGTDSSGTNFTFSTTKYDVDLHQEPITSFPDKIEESHDAYLALVAFYKSKKLTFWGHLKLKKKKLFSFFSKK